MENSKKDIETIYKLGLKLFPICRSITGNGVRESLNLIKKHIPKLKLFEVKSGTKVFDWVIPDEWYLNDARIKNSAGDTIVDYRDNNLHVVSYSDQLCDQLTFEELVDRLHYMPELPEAIPYRTTYYNRNWGFCVTSDQFSQLRNTVGKLDVVIDSGFRSDGSMTIGELLIPGRRQD